MPKIVNHSDRKELIAEAVWRIIRREGLEKATVRGVADEIGMSLGAVRHYFPTHNELLAFSMELLSFRVQQRVQALPFSGDLAEDAQRVIWELLPLDDQRLGEAELWLAFAGRASTDSAIRAISLKVHEELYTGFRRIINLWQAQQFASAVDAEYEAKRLHALIDGLAVHCVTTPERFSEEELKGIVSRHLDSLFHHGQNQ